MKNNLKKAKNGFTLFELLAVITVLALIAGISIITIRFLMKDVEDKLDDTSKNLILSSAYDYALEYRGTEGWNEERKDDEIKFCVSLNSLVDNGYFADNEDKFNKIRELYAVKFLIKNGVYNYEFVELAELEDNDICKYSIRNSTTSSNEIETKITENDKDIGTFIYKIDSLSNNKYKISQDLNLKLKEEITTKIYVNMLLDVSTSMGSKAYETAKKAITDFSQGLAGNTKIESNMSLIVFGRQPQIMRDFSTEIFSDSDFPALDGAGTNTIGAIDLVTSFYYNEKLSEDDIVYTVLLTDGMPLNYTYLVRKDSLTCLGYNFDINEKYMYPYDTKKAILKCLNATGNSDFTTNNNLHIEYYTNLYDAIKKCNNYNASSNGNGCKNENDDYKAKMIRYNYTNLKGQLNEAEENKETEKIANLNNQINTLLKNSWSKLKSSSSMLKDKGSNLFVINYKNDSDFFEKNGKEIASKNCDTSDKSCYYFADESGISTVFSNLTSQIITLSEATGARITIKSNSKDGNNFVKIYDNNDNLVDNIQREVSIDDNGEINFSNDYNIEISDYLFDKIKCDKENDVCKSDEDIQLFEIKLELQYPGKGYQEVEIEQPKFKLELTKIDTLN